MWGYWYWVIGTGVLLLLFAFQSVIISIWVSSLEKAGFPSCAAFPHLYEPRISKCPDLSVVVYPLPWPLLVGGVQYSRLWSTSQLLRPSGQQCSHSGGVCPQIQGWQCGAYSGCSWRDDVCRVCGCYRGDIVVMDVFWRRLCVSMIWGRAICLFWAGQECDEWGGEVSLQSCWCVVEVWAVCCYCLLWLDA